ncbi:SDR family NAD(P)-dependent oxidoreductase [Streptomyces pharetrae]|uniref:SDR family NAD(P)-dependent oxidoreductase n=1 Tax=Streptomyces pharetrae TaxID=291370 RepID=UPI00296EED83
MDVVESGASRCVHQVAGAWTTQLGVPAYSRGTSRLGAPREIRDAGGEATYIQADVRIAAQVQSFVDRVASRYGGIDVAFNNAGIGSGKLPHEMSVKEWDDVQATNARGVFLAIKYEIPHMLRAQRGVAV